MTVFGPGWTVALSFPCGLHSPLTPLSSLCPHWSLLTIVSLRLLGQLGLVDLVLSVGHLGVVLAVVLAEVSAHTSQLL